MPEHDDQTGLTMSDPLSAPLPATTSQNVLSMSAVLDAMSQSAHSPVPPAAPHPSIAPDFAAAAGFNNPSAMLASSGGGGEGGDGGGGAAGRERAQEGVRALTEVERVALSELNKKRDALKEEYYKRKEAIAARKAIEDRVGAALQGRTISAVQGARDLLSFVKGNSEMEDQSAKTFARFSGLFGQETGSSNDVLLGHASACKNLQRLHADVHNTLTSVEVKRCEESLGLVEAECKKLSAQAAQVLSDLTASRDKVDKALSALDKAWTEVQESEAHDRSVSSAEADPWLSQLRYQAASKALETVEAAHASDLRRIVLELKAMDAARLATTQAVLRAYAESRRALLAKALQHADELCEAVEKIQPDADCAAFLLAADVSDAHLVSLTAVAGVKSSSSDTVGDAASSSATSASTLGVWIPDDAVRNCNQCQQAFGLMRRKHHCRRCGHVFCDKCSARTCVLPPSFGFGTQQQRVCDTCLELLQQGDASESEGTTGDIEVMHEGSLLKRSGIGSQFKPRHFVCTRAGFLHYFDSKFDLTPKGSIPLHQARISRVDDDACALAIESLDGTAVTTATPSPAASMLKGFGNSVLKGLGNKAAMSASKKDRVVLRSALGSDDRDLWIRLLRSSSRLASEHPEP